jgi:hypothetical protein
MSRILRAPEHIYTKPMCKKNAKESRKLDNLAASSLISGSSLFELHSIWAFQRFGEFRIPFSLEFINFQFFCLKHEYSKAHRTIILLVDLYGRGNSSFTLTEEHRLSVFQNRMMRKIFVSEQEEVRGKWIKYYNESFKNFNAHQHVIQVIKPRRMR